jgi:hypothetical protein
MKEQQILKLNIEICDVHADRIRKAMSHVKHLVPIQPSIFKSLKDQDLGFLELLTSRFAKLQDTIGQKIFPELLEGMQEDIAGKSFLDLLNKLEKMNVIESVEFWLNLRSVRNSIAHEYPDNPELMAGNLNKVIQAAAELLDYWALLRAFIQKKLS